MKLPLKNKVNVAFVITIAILIVLGCDAWVTLKGKILDESGNPVSDAKILVEQGGSKVVEKTSKVDGSYETYESLSTFPLAGRVKITVSKQGYQSYQKTLSNEEINKTDLNIVLKATE